MLDVRCTTDTRKIVRLDYQPLFGKGARAGRPHARERQKSSLHNRMGKSLTSLKLNLMLPV